MKPNPLLHRYWITFERDQKYPLRLWYCGVTAYTLEDALYLVQKQVFGNEPIRAISSYVEDIDVSTLDPNHILPNIGVTAWRGVWHPNFSMY